MNTRNFPSPTFQPLLVVDYKYQLLLCKIETHCKTGLRSNAFQHTNKGRVFMLCLFLHDLWEKKKTKTPNGNIFLGYLFPR